MQTPVVHVCGPASAGKTVFARRIASLRGPANVRHLRIDLHDKTPSPVLSVAGESDRGLPGRQCRVNAPTIFEEVADLIHMAMRECRGAVIVETNTTPCFRHAFPYDIRVFVLRPPPRPEAIFRSPEEAARAMELAMHDTGVFAAEVFGLGPGPQDSSVNKPARPREAAVAELPGPEATEHSWRPDVTADLALRFQLRPEYHALMDSDVVLLNATPPVDRKSAAACVERIAALLETLRFRFNRQAWFAGCDLADDDDPRLLEGLERLSVLMHRPDATQA